MKGNVIKIIRIIAIAAAFHACIAPGILSPVQVGEFNRLNISNYPNPFDSRNGFTTIVYSLDRDAEVIVRIYDLFGNVVVEYPAGQQEQGTNTVKWDGSDSYGNKVAKGGYLAVVELNTEDVKLMAMRKIGVIH